MMLSRIDKMNVGDMPDFEPGMKQAAVATGGNYRRGDQAHDRDQRRRSFAADRRDDGGAQGRAVKVTTVAVGSHGSRGSQVMQDIATQTGGKYYVVNNANALPKIYQREARRIARPLVFEPQPPVQPQIVRRSTKSFRDRRARCRRSAGSCSRA